MLLILIVLALFILILLAYFGRNLVLENKTSQSVIAKELPPTSEPNEILLAPEIQKPLASVDLRRDSEGSQRSQNSFSPSETPEDVLDLEEVNLKNVDFEKTSNPMLTTPSLEIYVETETGNNEKTPEGSPKSTSSCISSDILTDSIIDGIEVSYTDNNTGESASSISRPSSFPMDFPSTSSSFSPPFLNFTRPTPQLIPRMMLEEFELLDRSIEKRKMDIRDLLRRIQSAKRRHRRFSEHIQRVQRENHINY